MKQNVFKRMLLLFLLAAPVALFAQGTVTGTITEAASGQPLPGVTILEKGTTNGTTSDFDGNYQITVNSSPATLVFSSLGYEN